MLITTIKIISMLYPFLKELLLGKNTNHKEVRRLKMALIVFIIVSVLLNFYLLKSSYQLSKHKITNSTKVLELEKTITDLNTKLAKSNVTCSNPNPVNNDILYIYIVPPTVAVEILVSTYCLLATYNKLIG